MITTLVFVILECTFPQLQDRVQALEHRDLERVFAKDGKSDIARLFLRESGSAELARNAIPGETTAFSERAVARCLRLQGANAFDWRGYMTANRLSEVMRATWTDSLGSFTWVDNGRFATVRCALTTRVNLVRVEDAVMFIESQVPKILNAPMISSDKFLHWLVPLEGEPKLWTGVVFRNVEVTEVKTSTGQALLRVLGEPEWHQRLQISTDGITITIYFELPEKQESPYGPNPVPGIYRPFRFARN